MDVVTGGVGLDQRAVRRRSWDLIRRLLRSNKRTLMIAVLAGVGWQLAGIVVPLVIGWTVDRGIEDGQRSAVWWGALALVVLGAIEAAGAAVRHRMACTAFMSSVGDLRLALTEAALGLDDDDRERLPPGEIIARETSDTDTVGGLLDSVGHTIAEMMSVPIILVALLLIDPMLALVVAAIVPISVIITWRYSVIWEKRAAIGQEAMGEVVAAAQETVEAGKGLRGIGAEAAAVERFAVGSAKLRRKAISLADLWIIFEPLLEVLSVLSVGVVLWIGGDRVISGETSLGGVITAVGFVLFLSGPVRTVGSRILTLQAALASADRIVTVLDAAPPADEEAPDPREGRTRVDLTTSGLSVSRRGSSDIALLRGDVRLAAGTVTLLRGATGSGKSTLLAVLAGLRPPLAGELALGGLAYDAWPSSALRRRVQLCGPNPFLFVGTIAENLRFARTDATDDELHAALAVASCEFVDALPGGLQATIGERGVTLSGGQRQRLAVARAVLARPSVLLLDGATSALDLATEADVVAALRGHLVDTAIVIVTDNPVVIEHVEHTLEIGLGRVVTS